MSLVISLTCALLSTLLQQWARRYQRIANPRYTPHKRARIRAFYKHGVEKLHIPWAIELLPALLHISLFLFFAGLSVYLNSIQGTIFKVVTAWIALCGFLYVCLTFFPIIHKNSPYSSPLSASVSFCLQVTGMRYVFFKLFQMLSQIDLPGCFSLRNRGPNLRDFFSHNMIKTAEKFAFSMNPDIDYSSLLWTFESLDEDTELEKFFEGLPRLCDSETGKHLKLQEGFILKNKKGLSSALIGLMDRTLSSNLVNDIVKRRRMIICAKVVSSTSLLGRWSVLDSVLFGDWQLFLGCIEFGLLVQNWTAVTDKVTSFSAQCVVALTISFSSRRRDERWFQLASGLLNKSKSVLHKYTAHGDNMLLANAIFIVRQTIRTYFVSDERHRQDILKASSRTLEMFCKLDTRHTLPDLRHEFCDLWNQLVDTALTDPYPLHSVVCMGTLKTIRKLYIALHENAGTCPTPFYSTTDDRDPILDIPKSYPLCMHDDHRPSRPNPDLQFDEPDSTMPMPISTFQYSTAQPSFYASNPLCVEDVQQPPPPLPAVSSPGSASSALLIHRTMYPPSESWGGHV